MKRETIYKDEEIEIFADENRAIWEYEVPYLSQSGEWVDNNSILPIEVDTNAIDGDFDSDIYIQVCPKTIGRMLEEKFGGRILSPSESFFTQMKCNFGIDAAKALRKYFKKELEQADHSYYQGQVDLLENN